MRNLVPDRYRQVTVAEVDVDLTAEALDAYLMGREVYRRTGYVVIRSGEGAAVVEVERTSDEPLFSPVVSTRLLAPPEETVYVEQPEVDVGVPSQLAAVAAASPGRRCVIVEGRYHHVNFILDPEPLRIRVRDVVPPTPAKLLDQAEIVLSIAEELPPIELVGDIVDIDDLIGEETELLLPCRGAGEDRADVNVSYLDQRPPRRDWTLVGCTRSRQIHNWFYGDLPPTHDFCPRNRPDTGEPTLAKCCLLEEGTEVRGNVVIVPWGSDLAAVRVGLAKVVELAAGESTDPVSVPGQ